MALKQHCSLPDTQHTHTKPITNVCSIDIVKKKHDKLCQSPVNLAVKEEDHCFSGIIAHNHTYDYPNCIIFKHLNSIGKTKIVLSSHGNENVSHTSACMIVYYQNNHLLLVLLISEDIFVFYDDEFVLLGALITKCLHSSERISYCEQNNSTCENKI